MSPDRRLGGGLSRAGSGGFEVVFSVVGPAEEFEVFEVGGSAVFPVADVVSFAERGRDVASGFGAVAVAGDERPPQRGGDVLRVVRPTSMMRLSPSVMIRLMLQSHDSRSSVACESRP